jgi:hypothetical protein
MRHAAFSAIRLKEPRSSAIVPSMAIMGSTHPIASRLYQAKVVVALQADAPSHACMCVFLCDHLKSTSFGNIEELVNSEWPSANSPESNSERPVSRMVHFMHEEVHASKVSPGRHCVGLFGCESEKR